MKPVNLKIKGLNSFVQQQTIEFSKLTEKGLFGIFGPTASGKSTILDGITIALYGKVSRDTKEFVNTETNVVEISFDFEIGLGKLRKMYRAERSIKRLKTGYFKTAYARLIEVNKENPDENNVLAEGPKDVEENIINIIGLKVEDFTRSVVLPQGKFNEFLKLTGKDRRNMLERIFALEKYGTKLYDKIKSVRNKNLNTKTMLEGEMKGYENVGEEARIEIKTVLDTLKEEEKKIKLQKSTLDKEYEEYKTIWELQQEKKQYVQKEVLLKLQEDEIKDKKEKFTKGSLALNVKPYMDNVNSASKSLLINKETLHKLNSVFEVICKKLNITKNSYDVAFKTKNDKLPSLIEKEVSLKQATYIEEKIINLAKEKDILLKKHKEITSLINEKSLNADLINTSKGKIEKELQVSEVKLSEIEILPEYREKLYNTRSSEIEVTTAEKNVEQLKSKAQALQKAVSNTNLLHNEALILKEKKQKKLALLEEKGAEIANNFPGDNNLLLKKQEEYSTSRDLLEKAVENNKIRVELEEKYSTVHGESSKVKIILKNSKENIENKKVLIKTIEANIKEIEISRMAGILSSDLEEGNLCPVCGSLHHPQIANLVQDVTFDDAKNSKQKEEDNLDDVFRNFQRDQIKFAGLLRDEENIINQLDLVTDKLKDVKIEELQEAKKTGELVVLQFKEKSEVYNKQKTELDLSLLKLRDEKSKADIDEGKLGEGLRKESETLIALQEELSISSAKLKLLQENYKLLNEELSKEEDSFKKKLSSNEKSMSIKEKISQIKVIDNEVIKLNVASRKFRTQLVDVEKQRVDNDKSLRDLGSSKTEIITSGKEKKSEIDRLTLQIVELCGFTPTQKQTPIIEVEKVRNEIKDITYKEANLKEIYEKETIERQTVQTQKTSEEDKKDMLLKMFDEGKDKLEKSLKENYFETSEVVSLYLISRGDLALLEKDIKKYEEVKRSISDNLLRVEKLLNGKEIDVTIFEEIKEKRQAIGVVLEEKTGAIGAQFRALEEMERKIKEIKTLLTKKKEVEHKLSLIGELDTLIQGKKFVEYVATKQLKYISMEASKRLKDITRGRYALELDADGAFIMRDDFNGGTRRETNTLSGGETFLTSLCLALALSSQIQLKGSAPLEFFFLDEGFGTLDTDLLDVVMNSLEKLHSSTLSVGIISHVEELRNRVPIKLIVTPAEQGKGGSTVKLEYT